MILNMGTKHTCKYEKKLKKKDFLIANIYIETAATAIK